MTQTYAEPKHGPIALGALPRRTRLTVSIGEGKPILRLGINHVARTWLTVVPLESHCAAARIGFANPFHEPMPIVAASICPSDSYNPVVGMPLPGTSRGVPTGSASGSAVSFDGGGLGGSRIVASGQTKGLLIPGDPGNPNNELRPFTIAWSDWVPVRSIPRTDGGTNPLLFIYVALDRGSMSTPGACPGTFTHPISRGFRSRVAVSLNSDLVGDWTANPSATSWSAATHAPSGNGSQWGLSPVFCVQYLSIVPGIQGVISGDSLMSGPGGMTGDAFSAAPVRAAYDLSSLLHPVCVAHMACGGAGSAVYNETLLRNIDALRPSFLVLQPLSRNDGLAQANLDALFARLLATSDLAELAYRARTIYQGAYPVPSVDPANGGSTAQVAAWLNARATLGAMADAGVPVYDGASVVGLESAPWLYGPDYSDDGTHPNDAATEMITPVARRLLEQMLEYDYPETGPACALGTPPALRASGEVRSRIDPALALSFGEGGNEDIHLGLGWSAGEAGFRWMIGGASDLWLEHPGTGCDYILELALGPFVRPPKVPQQRLIVSVRGTVVGQTALKVGGVLGYRIPVDILVRPGPVRLTFLHQDARRPCDVDESSDDRPLAVAVRQARLLRVRPAARPLTDDAGGSAGQLTGRATESTSPLPAPDAHQLDIPPAELVMKFDSLGDNCEFGLVQRRCGVEPLGLLRFANIELPSLLRGIHSEFAALGAAGSMRLQDDPDGKEYVVHESKYGLTYHTFHYKDQIAADVLLAQQSTRVKFLSRKLMDDIRGAEKIFVVKRNDPLSEQEILPLYVALNEYADNTLLWVVRADESHRPGSVESVLPGLLKAYIDRFAPSENAHDLSFEVWLEICAKAHALASTPPAIRRLPAQFNWHKN